MNAPGGVGAGIYRHSILYSSNPTIADDRRGKMGASPHDAQKRIRSRIRPYGFLARLVTMKWRTGLRMIGITSLSLADQEIDEKQTRDYVDGGRNYFDGC